jgi:hypothetical protein
MAVRACKADPNRPGFDRALIEAIYAERGRRDASGRLVHFRSSSHAVQDSVANRFRSERKDALDMLAAETAKSG